MVLVVPRKAPTKKNQFFFQTDLDTYLIVIYITTHRQTKHRTRQMENATIISSMTDSEFDAYMSSMIAKAEKKNKKAKRTAKAIAVYEGFRKQVAKREDGIWFERNLENNGYGKGWSKWKEAARVILINEAGEQYKTEGVAYDPTLEIPAKVMGGFSGDLYRTDLKARLPK